MFGRYSSLSIIVLAINFFFLYNYELFRNYIIKLMKDDQSAKAKFNQKLYDLIPKFQEKKN